MGAIVLGIAAALCYGISDFVGGIVSRRIHYALVAVTGFATATALIAAVLVLSSPPSPSADALLFGAASGLGGGLGTLFLYRGLGRGRMGVVAPLSAVGAAALPVVVGVALGERPSPLAWAGVALALPAIWLVSRSGSRIQSQPGDARGRTAELVDGLGAGLGFGFLFIALGLAGDGAGLWPVLASEVTSTVLIGPFLAPVVLSLRGRRPTNGDIARASSVGVFGVAAVVLYYLSTRSGLLSVVAVLTSLYPAATVLLAATQLHESIDRPQAAGIALAGAAIVLIVIG
jgi:drug/metabolite transporter (DMT)-like permease